MRADKAWATRLLLILLVLALLPIWAVNANPAADTSHGRPAIAAENLAVVAHRGSSGVAPENTLVAVEVAIAQRANWFEVDVQRSRDGELVLLHDRSLARTTDVEEVFPDRAPWHVDDFTLAELRRLDAGTWFHDDYAGEPIPTLAELVELVRNRIGLLLEVKDPVFYPGIEQDIVDEFRSRPGWLSSALAEGRLVVQSFDHESMRRVEGLASEIPVGLLFSRRPTDDEVVDAAGFATEINPSFRVTDDALVRRIHELGMRISVYTVNTGRDMLQVLDLGVDGVITDYPIVLLDLLKSRARTGEEAATG